MPLARATGIGSTFDCADHSKSVCFFDSAIISSPLMVASVSVAMSVSALQHCLAFCSEFVAGPPLRKLRRLSDAVSDGEEHAQVLVRAAQIPVREHDVLRLVVPVLGVGLARLLRI